MLRTCLPSIAFLCVSAAVLTPGLAQISVGVTQQNGVVSGSFFSARPVITNGGTSVRMGISAGFSQIVDVDV